MAKKITRRKILAGGLAAALAISTGGGIYYFAERESEKPEVRKINTGIKVLHESSLQPRGITFHSGILPSNPGDYLTYVVAVQESNLVKNLEEAISGEKSNTKFNFELRRLELDNRKESILCKLPLNRMQFAGGEQHVAVANSNPLFPDSRYERFSRRNNAGKDTYGILETVVSSPATKEVYADGRDFTELTGFAPVGADNKIWVAEFSKGDNRAYLVGKRGKAGTLTRKDVTEISVPMTADTNAYFARLEEELKRNIPDEEIVNAAGAVIRREIETAQRTGKARTELNLPINYNISCFSGNSVYGYSCNPKSGTYLIWKAELKPEKSKGDKK